MQYVYSGTVLLVCQTNLAHTPNSLYMVHIFINVITQDIKSASDESAVEETVKHVILALSYQTAKCDQKK